MTHPISPFCSRKDERSPHHLFRNKGSNLIVAYAYAKHEREGKFLTMTS